MNDFLITEITDDPYTIVPNFIINDPTWLMATKMTWIYIFSKRRVPGWQVRPFHIQKVMGYSDKIWRKVYTELYAGGYLRVNKTKAGTVITFIYDWSFKATPVDNSVDNPGDK